MFTLNSFNGVVVMKRKKRDSKTKNSRSKKSSKKDLTLQMYGDYALRLLRVSLILVVAGWLGIKYVSFAKPATQIPFKSELIIFAMILLFAKAVYIFPKLFRSVEQGKLSDIVRLSRMIFIVDVLYSGIFLFFPASAYGWLNFLFDFLKSNPNDLQNWIPTWASTALSLVTTTMIGAIIVWALTSWAWDAVKWLGSRIIDFFIRFWQSPRHETSVPVDKQMTKKKSNKTKKSA